MITPQVPFDAYRADLAQAPGLDTFGAEDGSWLLAAELLDHWARTIAAARRRQPGHAEMPDVGASRRALWNLLADLAPGGRRERLVNGGSTPLSAFDDDETLAREVLSLAERIEDGGALRLAYTVLVSLGDAMPGTSARTHGLVLAQRARIARQLGDLEVAEHLYDETARLGRVSRDVDLLVRASLGKGVVARVRGNYPRARSLFRRALRSAEQAALPELVALAHHGLLIAAGVAGDFDTALRHGWEALQRADRLPARQAELLGTLAALSSDAGYDTAALRAYLAAAVRSTVTRVRLPALAGAAVSAARLGDVRQLEILTRAVEYELQREALPYERAQALALLAQAWASRVPESAGEPYRSRALALAESHGFHELSQPGSAGGIPLSRAATPRATSTPPAATRAVLRALESLKDTWRDDDEVAPEVDAKASLLGT